MTRAQGDVLINWLSKRRGGTLCRQLSAAIAPLWAPFTRLSPRPEPANRDERRAFGHCRYRPWTPKSELLLRLPLTLFPLEALADRICR
jgi:hypothetical protein